MPQKRPSRNRGGKTVLLKKKMGGGRASSSPEGRFFGGTPEVKGSLKVLFFFAGEWGVLANEKKCIFWKKIRLEKLG